MTGIVRYKSNDLLTDNFGNNGGLTSHTYRVEIYDIQGTGILSPIFEVIGEPILNYESQSDKIYSTIKASALEFDVSINNDTDRDWFLNTFLQSTEERFIINLIRDGSVWWSGYPLYDLGELQDAAYPYAFKIKATDGLARLKNFEFTYATANDNFQSLTEYIGNILEKTPLFAYLTDISSISTLFSTCVNWYEYNMSTSYTDDPLMQSYLRRYVFANYSDTQTGLLTGLTYYDVLDKILLAFNCRIMLSDGYYKIVSISQYDSASTMYERCYTIGAYTSPALTNTVTNTWKTTIAQSISGGYVEAGNKWGFYPAAKNVKRILDYSQSTQNCLVSSIESTASTPFLTTWMNPKTLNTIVSDGNTQLDVSIPITILFPQASTNLINLIDIQISLALGGISLQYGSSINVSSGMLVPSNSGGWTSSSVYFETYIFQNIDATKTQQTWSGLIHFVTAPIPAGTYTNNTIQVHNIIPYYYAHNTYNTVGLSWSKAWTTPSQFAVKELSTVNNISNNAEYNVQNTSTVINSEDVSLDNGIFGEPYNGTQLYKSNNAYIYTKKTGSTYTASTGVWKIGGSGTGLPLNQLLAQEVCALLITPLKRYQGSLLSNIMPHWKMYYNSEYYILNGGEYSILRQSWNGEWIKVLNVRSSTYMNTPAVNTDESGILDATHAIGDINNAIGAGGIKGGQFEAVNAIAGTTAAYTKSSSITSIAVDSLSNTLYTGDVIKIMPNGVGTLISATVSANAAIGATSISISSLTLTTDLPLYSSIILPAYTATGFYPASGKRLIVNNTVTLSGTDGSTIAFGAGGSVAYQDQVNAFTKNNDFLGTTQYTAVRIRGYASGAASSGLYFGSYSSTYAGIWSDQVTPGSTNYALMTRGSSTYLNGTSGMLFAVSDSPKASFNTTGFLVGGDPSSYNAASKLDIVGALNGVALYVNVHNDHTGTYRVFEISEASSVAKIGFFGVTAVARQTQGATLTNNITSGGTANTLADWDASVAPDSAISRVIRNDMYQMGQTLKTVVDALRAYGLLT